ncbi:MAG: hypothetical protein IKZ53_04720 [Selenomonadaceae bacterium]|nr:hypothetical protein [Selenomonadaceae bacterium]
MATTDERVDKLETRFLTLEQRVSAVTAKIDTFIGEMRDFKNEMRQQNQMRAEEMRDRDNQRVAEIVELRQRQDADRKALEDKIDRLGDKIQNMVIAAVVGFGAIVFAAVSILK